MTSTTTHECSVRLKGATKAGHAGCYGQASLPAGRVPRVARLLALAHKFDGLLRQGAVANGAALARLGHVSRARITQILNLLHLAPDLQEQILFLPLTRRGRDAIRLRQVQAIAQILDWPRQRARWQQLWSAAYAPQERIVKTEVACPSPTLPSTPVVPRSAVHNWQTVPSTGKEYDAQG